MDLNGAPSPAVSGGDDEPCGISSWLCGYRADLPVPAMESFVGLNRTESFADLASDCEGFRTTVLRYGLLNGRFGSFFRSFCPHVQSCGFNLTFVGSVR